MTQQIELFGEHGKAILLLDRLVGTRTEGGKTKRETALLRNPNCPLDEQGNWAFCPPRFFNDALDIRKTARTLDGSKREIWTQGTAFFFSTGDVIHSQASAYANWLNAVQDGLHTIQVDAAKQAIPGRSNTGRYAGEVCFTIYKGNKASLKLDKDGSHTLSQDDFIRFLILGFQFLSSKAGKESADDGNRVSVQGLIP